MLAAHLICAVGQRAEVAWHHIALQLICRLHANTGAAVCRLAELGHALHGPLPGPPSTGLAAVAPLSHLSGADNIPNWCEGH